MPEKQGRNETMDLVKLVAAYGVVALHVRAGTAAASVFNHIFWPLCVPFFYVSSLLFYVGSIKKASLYEQLSRTFQRLVVPFISWTFIYLLLFRAKGLITGHPREFEMMRVFLFGESAVQLYFMPTLICIQMMALSLFLLLLDRRRVWQGLLCLVVCGFYIGWAISNKAFGMPSPGSIAGMLVYIIIAFVFSDSAIKRRVNGNRLISLLGICMIVGAILSHWWGYNYVIAGYPMVLPLGGAGLLFLVLAEANTKWPAWLLKLSATSFGIYLCHVIFLEGFEFLLPHLFKGNFVYTALVKFCVVSCIFIASILSVNILQLNKLTSFILLGEKKFTNK